MYWGRSRTSSMPRSKEQLRSLTMPVYVAMAADSHMHDSAAATRVARDNVRDLLIRNWPGATHSLPMEFPDRLNWELLDFVAAHDPPHPRPRNPKP